MRVLIHICITLSVCFLSASLFAQEKAQAYYNSHENEILPDARAAFHEGNYDRTVELCKWYYIIVGDTASDSLRLVAERCARIYSEMKALRVEAEETKKTVRLLALSLYSVNPDDSSVNDYLQWSAPDIADTIVTLTKQIQPAQDQFVASNMVDLGLSVKWATCNLGASKPEQAGYSFSWGETKAKENGTWENYRWCKATYKELTRYCNSADYGSGGFVDFQNTLLFVDDAAQYNLGGNWRMPTEIEVLELINQCDWQWSQLSGVDGYTITSKLNGNSIFLPVEDSRSFYWTSSLSRDRSYSAVGLSLRSDSVYTAPYSRCYGLLIRPITK